MGWAEAWAAIEPQRGRTFPPFRFVVEEGQARAFARAVFDDEDAISPTFSVLSVTWEGRTDAFYEALGLDVRRILHGGHEFEYVRPLRLGEELTVSVEVADVARKERRSGGVLILLVLESEYRTAAGELVQRARHTIIQPEDA